MNLVQNRGTEILARDFLYNFYESIHEQQSCELPIRNLYTPDS
jgi:hypothetical protein